MFLELCLLGIILIILWQWLQKSKNFPPGPTRLPILGNLLTLYGKDPSHIVFTKLRDTYGPMFSFYFGNRRALVLNDIRTIKEALNNPVFGGRAEMSFITERCGGIIRGIIHTDGPKQSELRRMVLKNLRDFGFGKQSMEGIIQDEINELISSFKTDVGKPITTQNRFNLTVLNALWGIVTGIRYEHDDSRLQDITARFTSSVAETTNTGFTTAFPWLVTLAPKISGWKNIIATFKNIFQMMGDVIHRHKETYDDNHARDFVDVYLKEMKNSTNPKSVFYGTEAETNFKVVISDLFGAGTDTTSTTMTFIFLLLALHPEYQEKLHDEIKNIVGYSRHPSLSDRPNMPYTQAVISESQRYASIAPLSIFHRTMEDVENFCGYFIPKDTIIIPNIYAAMRDPKVWTDPETFNPERFLIKNDAEQPELLNYEANIPFGIGTRVCIGQTLAKNELFLLVTNLFQQFEVKPDPNDVAKFEYYTGIVLIAKPHKLILTSRIPEEKVIG